MSKVKLGDVAIESREVYKGDKAGMPIVGLEHLTPEDVILSNWDHDTENTFTKMFRKGDMLFGRRRAYLKKAAQAPFDGICSGDITVIRAKEGKLLPELLPFIIQNENLFDFAVGKSAGSLSPRVKWENLQNFTFELPSLDEQKKLAAVLWAINDTIQAYQALLIQTEELVKAQFIEMTKGATAKAISDIALSFGRGKSPKYVEESKIKVINQACIYWDGLHYENVKYQNSDKFNEKNELKTDSVLVNATGTGTLGRSCVFSGIPGEKYMADSHVMIIEVNQQYILPKYLQIFLSLSDTQRAIYTDCVNGSTNQIELSKEAFRHLMIPVAELEVQRQFVAFAEQSDRSKKELLNALEAARSTKHSIVADALGMAGKE